MKKWMDSRIWAAAGYALDYFFLNFLWIFCSIPIVTIGAATTGAYYASFCLLKNGDDHVFSNFFSSFKQNFRQATVLWLIVLLVAAFLTLDISLCFRYSQASPLVIAIAFLFLLCAAFLTLILLLYLFPLQSWFDNALLPTLQNALILAVRHIGWTALLIVTIGAIILLGLMIKGAILFVPGILLAVTGLLYRRIFKKYE